VTGLRAWWEGLEARERWLVGSAFALAVLLAVQVTVQLVASQLAELRADVGSRRAALEMAHRLGPSAGGAPLASGPLSSIVEGSAGQLGLGEALRRVDDVEAGRVRARVEGARFADLVRWLASVEARGGATIDTLLVERTATPGRVDATVVWTSVGR
jgi:general secretion pathway protein M